MCKPIFEEILIYKKGNVGFLAILGLAYSNTGLSGYRDFKIDISSTPALFNTRNE